MAARRRTRRAGGVRRLQGEPIQIITDRTGRYLLSVFFYQSTVGVHAIDNDGRIAFPPIEWRYTAYGAHGIEISRSNRHVFVPHVARSGGPNAVAQLHFDPRSGRLTPNTPPFLSLHENEGPRHLVVHPTLNAAYSADEQGCTATAYRLDPVWGTLSKLHSISTVPSDYKVKGQIAGSEVLVHPNGRLLRRRQRRQRRAHGHLRDRRGHRTDDAARDLRRRQRSDVDSHDAPDRRVAMTSSSPFCRTSTFDQ